MPWLFYLIFWIFKLEIFEKKKIDSEILVKKKWKCRKYCISGVFFSKFWPIFGVFLVFLFAFCLIFGQSVRMNINLIDFNFIFVGKMCHMQTNRICKNSLEKYGIWLHINVKISLWIFKYDRFFHCTNF